MSLAAEDFSRIHPVLSRDENSANDSSNDIQSDFTALSFQRQNELGEVDRNNNKLSRDLKNLPEFNIMAHFAENYEKPPALDQSLGEIIQKQSRISRHSIGPESDEYSEFRNDALSTSTPIQEQQLSEENVSGINSSLSDGNESYTNNSTFTQHRNIKPPVQKISVPFGKTFTSHSRTGINSSGPESNVINILQQKVQREFQTLPIYSTAMKDDDGNYKVTCRIESGIFSSASNGNDKAKEIAKRKSAENMLKKLGDDYLLKKLPTHDRIDNITEAKKYFIKHLRSMKNKSVQGAFDSCPEQDGRSGLECEISYVTFVRFKLSYTYAFGVFVIFYSYSVCQHLYQMSRFPVIQFLPSEKITPSENGFICEISTKIRYKLKSQNLSVNISPEITSKKNHARKQLATRAAWNHLVNKIFEFLNNLGDDIVLN